MTRWMQGAGEWRIRACSFQGLDQGLPRCLAASPALAIMGMVDVRTASQMIKHQSHA